MLKRNVLIAGLLLLGAAGCATGPGTPQTVEARAQAKWDALIGGDLATAYGYYSPGYRSVVDVAAFERLMARRTVAWTGAEYRDTGDCDETACRVRVALHYRVNPRVPGAKPFEGVRIVQEDWIFTENQWFFVPKQ